MAVKPLLSLQRALAVLEAVAEHQPIGVAALARLLDEDKSALQRVLVTLDACGWIRASGDGATRWELSARPLAIASQAQRRSGLIASARPTMEDLRDATGETVTLALPDTDRIVAIDVVESLHMVRSAPRIGMVFPAETSAAGLALFAHLDDVDIAPFVADLAQPRFRVDLDDTRRRGWSLNAGAVDLSATSVGAAVLDAAGRPVAALVVSAPSDRLTAEHYEKAGRLVAEAAALLSPRSTAG
jgi:IclR family acetate operon transcriptional repressor